MAAYPHVQEFIDQNSAEFPELEVRYINGQRPQFVMLSDTEDGGEEEDEVTSLASWNRDTMLDYIKENLETSGSS